MPDPNNVSAAEHEILLQQARTEMNNRFEHGYNTAHITYRTDDYVLLVLTRTKEKQGNAGDEQRLQLKVSKKNLRTKLREIIRDAVELMRFASGEQD